MKVHKLLGIATIFTVLSAGASFAADEKAPSEAVVDACTSDSFTTFMKTSVEGDPELITYGMWGKWAGLVRDTMSHFKRNQFTEDDDLLHAAVDNIILKMQEEHDLKMTVKPDGAQHGCVHPAPVVKPELYVGQVDSCIADKSVTVSVLYGVVTRPTPAFRQSLAQAIENAVSTYDGSMESPDGLQEAISKAVISIEKEHGGETFFYFAPSGALQEGCHPQQLAL